eukprot:Plantae.Rhodophyta-Rhodochaete_pulchella.ctg3716.p1 GENE.Plantae.Rhodophyta-Rhodochaete_pulchella.ctg3716~~Plantae.Rhodophyta-Rhodochaete_pulchella.ctg3716.p1  ORF type:complete len:118 (-),score=17.05 Plantae.Rhodophyta-Rhodochaete_pulchella.ctg3716:111-464(-)
MNALITNDLQERIINVVLGFPGSVHDARVLRAARFMRPEYDSLHFDGSQFGLGDAAVKPSLRMITPYKKPLSNETENSDFNSRLSSLRISSEHTIGILKGRFQSLKELRTALGASRD